MAYKGKFSQPRNTEEALRLKAQARKEAAAAAAKPENQSVPKADNTPAAAKETPVKSGKKNAAPGKKRKVKKGNRNITIIFYTFYFCLIAAFVGGMFFLNNWLDAFLINYQNSQPTAKCEEIFAEHFGDPDWTQLYHQAGLTDTLYEGADSYAAYMSEKVGSSELTYVETSAGLSGGHKYLIKLEDETLGYFLLKDASPDGSSTPDWQLAEIHLNTVYAKSVRVQTAKGHKVLINGVPLEDTHIVQIATTLAGNYLPVNIKAPTTCIYQLDGLMAEPQITVTDENGVETSVIYDEQSDLYIEQTEANTIPEAEHERAIATAKTYALRMIEKASAAELAKYFDKTSQTYKTIISIDPWMQEWFFSSYKFENESVTGYYRYSDNLFSCHVKLSMFVTRTDDTVKEYEVDHTLFFELQGKTWKCINMTNVDVNTPIAEVRLTFMLEDNVLFTNMFDNDITSLKLPTVSAPEGQVFAGWFRMEMDETGAKHYVQVFPPAEDDTITLPAGTILEPMTLYALFEPAN